MRSISYWAKHNAGKARLLIVLSEIVLFLLAVRLGLLLLHAGIRLPGIAVAAPLAIFGAAIFVYRYKKEPKQQNNRAYRQQRLCFFLVGLSMFLLTSFMVSSEKLLTWNAYPTLSGFSMLLKPAPSAGERFLAAHSKKAERLLKKMQKHEGLKWLYVFLVIVGGLLLLSVVSSLACSLSCNGNEALAWVVFLLGGSGVVFLCVWLIRKILKGKKPKEEQTALAPAEDKDVSTDYCL